MDLELPELDGHRSVYLVLFEQDSSENFLACAKIRMIHRKVARASFSHEGVRGAMIFDQVGGPQFLDHSMYTVCLWSSDLGHLTQNLDVGS